MAGSPARTASKPEARTPAPGVQTIRFAFREGPAALYLVAEDAATGKRLNERLFRLQGDGPAGYEDFGLTWLADCRRLIHGSGSFGAGVNNHWLSAYREDLRGDWSAEAGNFALVEGVLVADAWESLRDTNTGNWAGLIGLAPATGKLLWWRTGDLWVSAQSAGCVVARDRQAVHEPAALTVLRPSDGRVLGRSRTENSEGTAVARVVGGGGPPASLTSGRTAGRGLRSPAASQRRRLRLAWAVPVPPRSLVQLLDAGPGHLAIVLTATRMTDSDEVWGIALASGKVAWKHRYPSGALILPEYRRWVSRALGVSRDRPRLYLELETTPGDLEHRLIALDWRTGREMWRLQQYGWEPLPGDRVWTYTIQGGVGASQVRSGGTGRILAGSGADGTPASPPPMYNTTAVYEGEIQGKRYHLQRSTGDERTSQRGRPYASGVYLKELEVVAASSGQTVFVREQATGRFALRGFGPDLAQRWVKPAGF